MNYNFLSKVKKLRRKYKIIILVALFTFLGPLAAVIWAILADISVNIDPKIIEEDINLLKNYYDILRPYVKNSDNGTIYIGSYVCEHKGKASLSSSKYISMYATDIVPSIEKEIPFIEYKKIGDKAYFQLPIKKKYSKTEKITIIQSVLQHIEENYPEDKLLFDKSAQIGMSKIDVNRIMDIFG